MENIKIKQIKKDSSDENVSQTQSHIVIELSSTPSEEWNKAFDQNALSAKPKQFVSAICDGNTISVKYNKTSKRDDVFNQIESLVNETNKEQDDFNSWIDKTNARLNK